MPENETVLQVSGMSCDGCVQAVTRVLNRVEGVERAVVDLTSARAHVQGTVAPKMLIQAVERAGFGARIGG